MTDPGQNVTVRACARACAICVLNDAEFAKETLPILRYKGKLSLLRYKKDFINPQIQGNFLHPFSVYSCVEVYKKANR